MSAGKTNNRVFIDTNVLIGYFSGSTRFNADKECLRYLFALRGKELYVSSLSIAQLVSVFQKKRTNDDIKRMVRVILRKCHVISFTEKDIDESLDFSIPDMEDCIQYVLCRKLKCLFFITNNISDYTDFATIKIFKPGQVRLIYR